MQSEPRILLGAGRAIAGGPLTKILLLNFLCKEEITFA